MSQKRNKKAEKKPAAVPPPEEGVVSEPDVDDDTRWWVIATSSVAGIGSTTLGSFEERPKHTHQGDITIFQGGVDEPVVYVNLRDVLYVGVVETKHLFETPVPTAPVVTQDSVRSAAS